jgi:ABC-type antimicrobial peptide transport system permease subunit
MILRDVAVLVAVGIAIGLPAAWGLGRYVSNQLFEMTPTDPATMAGAVMVLAIVGMLAGLIPARRAARINPITALRYD